MLSLEVVRNRRAPLYALQLTSTTRKELYSARTTTSYEDQYYPSRGSAVRAVFNRPAYSELSRGHDSACPSACNPGGGALCMARHASAVTRGPPRLRSVHARKPARRGVIAVCNGLLACPPSVSGCCSRSPRSGSCPAKNIPPF